MINKNVPQFIKKENVFRINIIKLDNYEIIKNEIIRSEPYSNTYKGKCINNDIINKFQLKNDNVIIKHILLNNVSKNKYHLINDEINLVKFLINNSHNNIIKYIDIIIDDTNIYIISEYIINNNTLDEILINGALKEETAKKYFTQLYNTILYLYNNKIYQEIKKYNIIIDNDNDNIKLCNFGLTHNNDINTILSNSMPNDYSITYKMYNQKIENVINEQQEVIYENYKMIKDIDKKILFSLGVLLYEIISGNNFNYKITEEYINNKLQQKVSKECIHLIKELIKRPNNNNLNYIKNHEWMKTMLEENTIIKNNETNNNIFIIEL